jgi:hypothetical protein
LSLPGLLVGERKALLVAAHQTQPLAVPLLKAVESVWLLVVSLEAPWAQQVLQPAQ